MIISPFNLSYNLISHLFDFERNEMKYYLAFSNSLPHVDSRSVTLQLVEFKGMEKGKAFDKKFKIKKQKMCKHS